MERRLLRILISGSRMLDWVFEQSASLTLVLLIRSFRELWVVESVLSLHCPSKKIFRFYPQGSS